MLEALTLTEKLAALIGLYVIVVSIGAIIDSGFIKRMVEEMRNSIALIYISGIMTFVLGGALVALHNDWSNGLAIFVSLFGWATLIKGSLILAFRQPFMDLHNKISFTPSLVRNVGIIMLLVGTLILYCAF